MVEKTKQKVENVRHCAEEARGKVVERVREVQDKVMKKAGYVRGGDGAGLSRDDRASLKALLAQGAKTTEIVTQNHAMLEKVVNHPKMQQHMEAQAGDDLGQEILADI
eukprot:1948185-Rhodomonas_salina.1